MVAWNLWCSGVPSTCQPGCQGVRHMRRDSPLEPSRSFFVRESRESLKQHYSSWELHRSHNLKMAPPQSINAIGHHLMVLKPFLILNCGSHTNGLEFFISLATQIPFFALIIHRWQVSWLLGCLEKKTRFLKVNWEIKGLQRSKEVSMEF